MVSFSDYMLARAVCSIFLQAGGTFAAGDVGKAQRELAQAERLESKFTKRTGMHFGDVIERYELQAKENTQ